MNRLTLRLPASLKEMLAERAQHEGVSLNQYIVYALTQQSTLESVRQQRQVFERLRDRVPAAQAEADLQALLAARK